MPIVLHHSEERALRSETLETFESQTEPERMYEGVPSLAELEKQEEPISEVVLVANQSMMHNLDGEEKRVTCRKLKQQRLGDRPANAETAGQDGGSASQKPGATASQVQEISAAANDSLNAMLAERTVSLNPGLPKMNDSMRSFA